MNNYCSRVTWNTNKQKLQQKPKETKQNHKNKHNKNPTYHKALSSVKELTAQTQHIQTSLPYWIGTADAQMTHI